MTDASTRENERPKTKKRKHHPVVNSTDELATNTKSKKRKRDSSNDNGSTLLKSSSAPEVLRPTDIATIADEIVSSAATKEERRQARKLAKAMRKNKRIDQLQSIAEPNDHPSAEDISWGESGNTKNKRERMDSGEDPKNRRAGNIRSERNITKPRNPTSSLFALPEVDVIDGLAAMDADDILLAIQTSVVGHRSSSSQHPKVKPFKKQTTKSHLIRSSDSTKVVSEKGHTDDILATKWLSSKELAELVQSESLEYNKGKFSTEEKDAIQKSIDTYQRQNGLTDDGIREMIFRKERLAHDNEFWTSIARGVGRRPVASIYHYIRRAFNHMGQQGTWTKEEDQALKIAVATYGERWETISQHVGRTGSDCRDRYRNYLKHELLQNNGPWSKDEEARLTEIVHCMKKDTGVEHDDELYWTTVAEQMNHTRNRQQCRTKWKDSLAPRLERRTSRAQWSDSDTSTLLEKLKQLDVSEEQNIHWHSLEWGGWSAHRLQKSWKRLKRRANVEGSLLKDALEALSGLQNEGRKSNHGIKSIDGPDIRTKQHVKFISREFIDSEEDV